MRSISSLCSLKGQVALITGGAGYVGRALAGGLAEMGCSLVLVDLPGSKVVDIANEISHRYDSEAWALEVDLERDDGRLSALRFFDSKQCRLDILINNAAFVGDSKIEGWAVPFANQSVNSVRRCLEVNLTAAFHLAQILTPLLAANNNGRILNVSSIYGIIGPDMSLYSGTEMGNPAAYAISKGGLLQLTRWLSTVLAPKIRVNSISLGGIFRNQNKLFVDRYIERTPLGRMATEEDFIGAALYFSSDLSSYVTGQNLTIDGGWTAW